MALVDLQEVKDFLWIDTTANDARLNAILSYVLDTASNILGDLSNARKTIIVNKNTIKNNSFWLTHVNPISLHSVNWISFTTMTKWTDYLINPDGMVVIPDIYQYLWGDFDYISVEYESGWEETETPDTFIGIVANMVGLLFSQDLTREVVEETTGPHKTVFAGKTTQEKQDPMKNFRKQLRRYIPLHLKAW